MFIIFFLHKRYSVSSRIRVHRLLPLLQKNGIIFIQSAIGLSAHILYRTVILIPFISYSTRMEILLIRGLILLRKSTVEQKLLIAFLSGTAYSFKISKEFIGSVSILLIAIVLFLFSWA